MNILSLFDGISCGQIALNKINIKIDKYFASEIDINCIKVTQKNYPNTIQLGDIRYINGYELPKIDLLIGGSPCVGFSNAGKRLNFEDKQSILFWEYVRLLKETKPTYFLLENVKMRWDWKDIITEALGVEPILINSNLVSAQNRPRYYWSNIPNITQPADKGIFFSNILEENITNPEFLFDNNFILKNNIDKIILQGYKKVVLTERRTEEAKRIRREHMKQFGVDFSPRRMKELVPRNDDKCNCLTTFITKENIVIDEKQNVRKLTPIEIERLQIIPDNYTSILKNYQRYKVIGNSWTTDVIAHILSFIKINI
jgi:site-specific DNA-cytosine methylase